MLASIQPLDRVALELGPISIYWYGIIIALGAYLGLLLAIRETERQGLPKETFVDLILWAVPIAIISARIYYVTFQWSYYKDNLGDIFAIWEGGIAIHGALIGSVITAIVFTRKRGLSFWKIADIAAPSILLGQAIGRWGNFMNQEAHGGPVTRAFLENMMLPEFIINQMYIDGTYYHPTFLYESLWNFAGVVLLVILQRTSVKKGEVFLSYVIWYSFGRYFIESLRTDSLMLTESLRVAQVISVVLIIVSVALIIYRRKVMKAKPYNEKR
ncbi:prolipoprotein diacylglyceryl transferase [Bacillus sp. N1-1]|jgi:phosphatidylglycerol---prolipoprotein diacylglyceryl transferase|uniref:prolipoprotein diacylglyceryl transferase n=1 Tax=Bacillus sp. N1-1 TaxID=2682541 RepID=UPI00131863C8|nr:prolipoprotein diacylglyceryl transferase [Bacillus sp. N1-1]QHA93371.1 prolipoprotein diacylglyceryl transferase [Bacillus sp. N1-1]